MQRGVSVGERLLVAGESRWGEGIAADAIAWECGFTTTFNDGAAAEWESAARPSAPGTLVPAPAVVTIDLGAETELAEPVLIREFPVPDPGERYAQNVFVAPGPGNRIAVLDVVESVVHFFPAGGDMIETVAVERPADDGFRFGGFVVGPGDVMYLVDVGLSDGRISAYSRATGTYRQVASSPLGEPPADGQARIVAGPTGPAFADAMTEPILPYVDDNGRASDITIEVEPILASADDMAFKFERGTHTWRVNYEFIPTIDFGGIIALCAPCIATTGPNDSVVLIQRRAGKEPNDDLAVTVLSAEGVHTQRVQWNYGGATEDNLIFYRFTPGVVEIGVLSLTSFAAASD